MKFTAVRRLLDFACRIYTIASLLLCFLQLVMTMDEMVIHPTSFLLLFPFALCFAGAELIRKSSSGSPLSRLLGHFVLLTAGIVCFVFLPAGIFSSGSSALVMVCTYLLIYLLAMLAVSAINTCIKRQKAEAKSTYSSQYANLRDKK